MSYNNPILHKYDNNGTGKFDPSLIGTILKDMGITPNKSELLDAIQTCKPDDDDKIKLSDFDNWQTKTFTSTKGSTYNRLLLKDPLGKGRRSGFDLPPSSHTYGKIIAKDAEGAGEVILGWKMSKPSATKAERRDIVKMNKMATMSGCTNPSAVRTFHRDHEVLLKKKLAKKVDGVHKLSTRIRSSTFGQPSVPNDCSINVLLNQDKLDSTGDYPVIERKAKTIPAIRSTKAARGQDVRLVGVSSKKRNLGDKRPFKLKKFERIPHRVQSFNGSATHSLLADGLLEEKEVDIDEYTKRLEAELEA